MQVTFRVCSVLAFVEKFSFEIMALQLLDFEPLFVIAFCRDFSWLIVNLNINWES